MQKRKAIPEITTVESSGAAPVYVPFVNEEIVQSVIVKEANVTATFKVAEGNRVLGDCITKKASESVVLGGVRTACLIIETPQETKFEVLTIR